MTGCPKTATSEPSTCCATARPNGPQAAGTPASPTLPLTRTGEQQARLAGLVLSRLRGTNLPPALVLGSPRTRALRTAELAGLEVDELTEELAEWDYGDYEGLTTEEIQQRVPHWTVWSHPIPNGETAEQVGNRAQQAARPGHRRVVQR